MSESYSIPTVKANLSLPGHVKKAFKSIERYLPVIDVVLEIVDARMPLSSRVHGFVEKLNKKYILILNKADLADELETKRWIKWFKGKNVYCTSLDAHSHKSVNALVREIKNFYFLSHHQHQAKSVIRIIVIGIPNIGKSTIINSLAKRHATMVANKPGITKNIQWVKVDKSIELLDLPGILDFKLIKNAEVLRLINCIPGPQEDPEIMFSELVNLLERHKATFILPNFNLIKEASVQLYLQEYAKKMNFLCQGGIPDTRRAALDIIKRFQNGDFGRITIEKVDIMLNYENQLDIYQNNGFVDTNYQKQDSKTKAIY